MSLSLEPRLPDWKLPNWPERLTQRLNEYLRNLVAQIRPWIGPSWDDLRFPAQGINPAGSAAPPSVDNATFPGTLLFNGTAENTVGGVAQMPHSWLEGGDIRPHVHWTKTIADANSNGVTWEYRHSRCAISLTAEAYISWQPATLVAGNLTGAEVHNISAFGSFNMTGFAASDMVIWQIRRLGNTDSYTADARLLEFDFHYQLGQVGTNSKQEYPTV